MQEDSLVTPILRLSVMLIDIGLADRLTMPIIAIAFTDGFILMSHFVGMHHNAYVHVLRATPTVVGDMASVGGCANRRCGHWMLYVGIVQGVGRCPAVRVVPRSTGRQSMQGGRLTLAELRVIGGC